MESYVSVNEAARIKKVTRQAIYLAIRLKRLKAYTDGNKKLKVFLLDLEAYDERKFSRLYHSTIDGERVFDDEKGLFSVDTASKLVNINQQRIYYAIRKGKLKAHKRKAAWVVHVNDLLEYHKQMVKSNFTEKCVS
jgi:hypothetical protein